jgi:hypothetical protein
MCILTLLLACSFVTPTVEVPPPTLDDAAQERVDATRTELLSTDAGAELWRSLDAHGTLGRFELLGPPIVELADGTVLRDTDPRYRALLSPFLDPREARSVAYDGDAPRVRLPGVVLHLDAATRRVRERHDDAGRWQLLDHRDVERLTLPHRLIDPAGTEHRVASVRFEAQADADGS